jgi:hypothetical protein
MLQHCMLSLLHAIDIACYHSVTLNLFKELQEGACCPQGKVIIAAERSALKVCSSCLRCAAKVCLVIVVRLLSQRWFVLATIRESFRKAYPEAVGS